MALWPSAVHQHEEHDMNRTNTTTKSTDQRNPNECSRSCGTLGLTLISRMIDPRLCLLISSIAGVAVTVRLTG